MDITAFIRELLFGNDCVIVPGFGGFIGNYTPARIERNSGTFYPPVKQISFNRNLNHNDGLLVTRISESSDINYGEARNLVEEFVSELRRKLEKGQKVIFDNIGSFVNNHEGNVQFEPDRTSNYHLDSYGLESFRFLPLEGYDLRKRVTAHIQKDPVRQASVRKILWRAAVIVPLLSILVAVPLKTDLFKTKVETTTMNPLVSAEFEQNKLAVDQGIKDETEKTAQNVNPEPVEPPKAEVVESAIPKTNTYFLITGSFRIEKNALSQVSVLKSQGFTPEIVIAPNGFYRVCAIACNNLTTAVTKKDSIIEKFPDLWISRK